MCLRIYAHAVTANTSSNWHQKVRSLVRPSTYQPATQLPMLSTIPPQAAIYMQHHYHYYFVYRALSLHTDDTVEPGMYPKGVHEVRIPSPKFLKTKKKRFCILYM
uniref:Uncharacterized protein n=1 Tax=Schizaphis graminum TaxID=13262 RepID=A0A2S2PWA1_SCHGA